MKITKEMLDKATKELIKSCQYSISNEAKDYAFEKQYPYWSDATKAVIKSIIPHVQIMDDNNQLGE